MSDPYEGSSTVPEKVASVEFGSAEKREHRLPARSLLGGFADLGSRDPVRAGRRDPAAVRNADLSDAEALGRGVSMVL